MPKPDWSNQQVEVDFYFVFERKCNIPDKADQFIENILANVVRDDWLVDVFGFATALNTMTAETYLNSHEFLLDFLSTSA
jgi:hypothetical protein